MWCHPMQLSTAVPPQLSASDPILLANSQLLDEASLAFSCTINT